MSAKRKSTRTLRMTAPGRKETDDTDVRSKFMPLGLLSNEHPLVGIGLYKLSR